MAQAEDISDRAILVARMIPAYAHVLALGPEIDGLNAALPEGCSYAHQGLDGTAQPDRGLYDIVVIGDMLGRNAQALALMSQLRALDCPLITHHEGAPHGIDFLLESLARQAGFVIGCQEAIGPAHMLCKWLPAIADAPRPAPREPKRVLVLSYYNDANFGDRLGYHLINAILPADAVVVHASIKPWTVPDMPFDLLILGIGNSLNAATVARPELHALLDHIPHSIGIFGTQYRYQYGSSIAPGLFDSLLSRLTTWWARYEEDIAAFGRGRENVRHLGDWLISAFPMAVPTKGTLIIPPEFRSQEALLDRAIQQIQSYRRVSTARIHPMLCALPSAEEIAYQEQHEDPSKTGSGKFRSQLLDIFGRTFEENVFFKVDRDAVARYKVKVAANIEELRAEIARLLA